MKSKLNTILQLAIIVLLAVVIVLQIFSIRNRKRQKRQSCVSPDWLINRVCFPNE